MLTVRYFAALREQLGCASETLPVPEPPTLAALLAAVHGRHGTEAYAALTDGAVRLAHNQVLLPVPVDPDQPVAAGDELAFLPPVTGG